MGEGEGKGKCYTIILTARWRCQQCWGLGIIGAGGYWGGEGLRLHHNPDSEVAQSAVLGLGIIGTGGLLSTSNAQLVTSGPACATWPG